MSAWYNEIDPAATHVLRALIADGVIAPGEVDTRSIVDVSPDDLRGFTQCHFFAGGGLWSVAARMAGWEDERPLWTGSCPCQPFSQAGKQRGFDDERDLWPEFGRLIRAIRPPVVVGEQVVIPCRAISLEDVQVMRGAQAIHGILCKLEGPNAGRLHRMLQGEGAAEEVWFDGASIGFAQEMESEQSCGGSYHISKIPGETEGPGVRSGRGERASTDEDRQGRMRGDGDSLRPGRWQNLEFAFARQDRSDDRISFDECSRGDLRPECDAEHMGRDNADGRRRQTKGAKRRGRKQPSWSVGGETSPEAGRHWVDRIATDLGQDGYAFRTCNLPAAAVDAPHIRQRLYWVAVGNSAGQPREWGAGSLCRAEVPLDRARVENGCFADRPSDANEGGVALADADRGGCRGRAENAQRRALGRDAAERAAGALGDAERTGLEGLARHGDGETGRSLAHRPVAAPDGGDVGDADLGGQLQPQGAVSLERGWRGDADARRNGSFWSDAEWIACHDGRARRAKPGLRLLVDGVPGRVGLWRIAGNAIVPALAAEVLAALRETLDAGRAA